MEHLRELHRRHQDQGLVLIGIHSTKGGENMPAFVAEQGIEYPVAIDQDYATVKRFHVTSYPKIYLIDRAGTLRLAELAGGDLDGAIERLLAEPARD